MPTPLGDMSKRLRKCRHRKEREVRRGESWDHTIYAAPPPSPNCMWLRLMAVFGKAKAKVRRAYLSMVCVVGREAKTQAFLATRWLRFGEREIEVWRKGSVLHLVWTSPSIMTGSTPAAV
jgi:hypothetical protein